MQSNNLNKRMTIMKNKFFLACLVMTCPLKAQEMLSYKIDNGFIEFGVSNSQYFVSFQKGNEKSIQNIALKFTKVTDTTALITLHKSVENFEIRKAKVSGEFENHLKRIEPVLLFKDGTLQTCNSQLILKLKTKLPLKEVVGNWPYQAVPYEYAENQYLVTINNSSTHDLFSIVTVLNANKHVEFAEPNFTRYSEPFTNDNYYNSQWSIDNKGYLGGTIDADMDVDDAWSYVSGHGIKVAMIDEGVDLAHPDLAANILPGYDAITNSPGGESQNNDYHGTACAGIVILLH